MGKNDHGRVFIQLHYMMFTKSIYMNNMDMVTVFYYKRKYTHDIYRNREDDVLLRSPQFWSYDFLYIQNI